MERLTEKINGEYRTNRNADIDYIDTYESTFIGNVIDKLAKFENLMEELGLDTIEELKKGYSDNKQQLEKEKAD